MLFIDLFCGIGGLSFPFYKDPMFKCVYANDSDKYCIQTYEANFPINVDNRSILNVPINEIPDHNLLLAGFPCQPYSVAGKRLGLLDSRGGDIVNRMIEIIKGKQPEICLLENVLGLLFHNKGETLHYVIKEVEKSGYKCFYKALNSHDYGNLQTRKRLYIICIRNDIRQNFIFPERTSVKMQLKEILKDNVDSKYTLSSKLWEWHQRRKIEHKKKGNGFGYNIYNENSSKTATLSARYYKDGAEILVQQKNNTPRKLTPRECARLMGFPDSFKLPCSDNQTYKQLGNSVCLLVIEALKNKILQHFTLA
jgi:DNA (cytosine-5)-methyltransferase 1